MISRNVRKVEAAVVRLSNCPMYGSRLFYARVLFRILESLARDSKRLLETEEGVTEAWQRVRRFLA